MEDENDIEQDPITHPPKGNLSRRTVIVGLVGFAAAEALTGGLTWPVFSQVLHKIVLAFAPGTAASLPRGTVLNVYHGHSAAVNSVKWSPDNKRVVSGSDDKTMQVWNGTSRNALFIYQGRNDAIVAVAWSSDGTRIASGSSLNLPTLVVSPTSFDPTNCLQDSLGNWMCTATLSLNASASGSVNWSVSNSLSGVTFNAGSGTLLPGQPTSVTITILASDCSNDTFTFTTDRGNTTSASWNCSTPTVTPTDTPTVTSTDTPIATPTATPTNTPTPIPTDTPTPILVAPMISSISPVDGPTTGSTQVTIIGSGFTGATSVSFGSKPSTTFLVTSDTEIVAVSPAGSGTVNVTITTQRGTSITDATDQFTYIPAPTSVPIPAPFDCLASELHTYTFTGIVDKDNPPLQKMTLTKCHNGGTEAWSASVFTDSGANWLTISSKGGILSEGSPQMISIGTLSANLLPGTYTGHITLTIGTSSVKIAIRFIVSLPPLIDTSIQVWNAKTGSNPLTYHGYKDGVSTLTWSPDGKRIASSGGNSTVQVWDAANGSPIFTYKNHSQAVLAVAWSPDGTRIASGSGDATVQVWNANTGSRFLSFTGHSNAVNTVAWSPDGTRIASGSGDATVQVWNASDGNSRYIYRGHLNAVNTVAWSPDGTRIASGSLDTTVQVWKAV